MVCEQHSEDVPFLVNGTLDGAERAALEGHLAHCALCQRELEEVRTALWIMDRHPPAEVLADYACGLPLDDWPRAELEQHLALCPSCAADLDPSTSSSDAASASDGFLDGAGRVVEFPRGRRAPRTTFGPWTALAALILVALGAGLLLRLPTERRVESRAENRVESSAFHEILPEDMVDRDRTDVVTFDPSASATLLLVTADRLEDGSSHRLVVRTADGAEVDAYEPLRPVDPYSFAVHVPAGAWPAGDLVLAIERRDDASWTAIGRYQVHGRPDL